VHALVPAPAPECSK